MDKKRHQAKPEGSHGLRNRNPKEQLHLGSGRTSRGIYRKALLLEIMKQIDASSVRMQKMSVRTLWRGRSLQNRKRDCT
jgi:hypothetical protein